MGSVRLPNLSINSTYNYFKNIFSNSFNFWFYYYSFFYFKSIINFLVDDLLVNLNFFRKANFFKLFNLNYKNISNNSILGEYKIFKIQNWYILNFFFCNKTKGADFFFFSDFNFNLFIEKKKMNYKFFF